MKMLLTSAGITNPSIMAALLDLLGKPIAECNALCIPTAVYAHPMAGPHMAWDFFNANAGNPMVELGWKRIGVLELTTLTTISKDLWGPLVEDADVLLVAGGETMYLAHWMRASGLAEMLPTLKAVWVGLSAGSVVMSPHIGKEFVHWPDRGGDDTGLGLIDFAMYPHLDHPSLPEHTLANAKIWSSKLDTPTFAIDDDTAIKWVDGEYNIVSEGTWVQLS